MKIAVVNIYDFPQGMAPTVRILSYTKGLVKYGVDCEIISIKPKRDKSSLCGNVNGVKYFHFDHCLDTSNKYINSLDFRFRKWICRYKAIKHILSSNKIVPYDCIIISYDSIVRLFSTIPFFSLTKSKIVTIADEYPTPIRKYMKHKLPLWKVLMYKVINRYIDGRILMTNNLLQFFNKVICVKPSTVVSTIVDVERFVNSSPLGITSSRYICYMGNMELSKDNVDNIIDAFNIIKDDFEDVELHLYGTPSKIDLTILHKQVQKYNLENRVRFMGRADYKDVPRILKSAEILVASQPNTKRAEGGFPTKMGEYFISGVPSIFTNVGEVGQYAKDGQNCIIVSPSEPYEYADAMRRLLTNKEYGAQLANNAKLYIETNYSCESAANSIINFIQKL